jgi:hypothetical protein
MKLCPGNNFILTDARPESTVTLDSRTAALLSGDEYELNVVFTLTASQTQYIELKTGTKQVLFSRELYNVGTSAVLYSVFEAPTITDGTVVTTHYNANRNSVKTSESALYSAPTAVSGGAALSVTYLPSTALVKASYSTENEMVYKPNTTYAASIINQTATATVVYAKYRWHELQ